LGIKYLMKKDNDVSRYRTGSDQLVAAIRLSQNASDMLDEAFAALLKVNRTDSRCLDIVQHMGRITAGELAVQAGLTTGAVTAVIDRMEAAGYLRRLRVGKDRRKVHVELTEIAEDLGRKIYGQFATLSRNAGEIPADEAALIARFLTISAEMNRKLAEILRSELQRGGSVSEQATRFVTRIAAMFA